MKAIFLHRLVLALIITIPDHVQCLDEEDRVNEYHARGHQWPPRAEDYIPETEGWRKLHERKFSQLPYIENRGNRYDGYMTSVHTGLTCKNFTESGWGLTRAPEHIIELLRESLLEGLEKQLENPTYENKIRAIDAVNPSYFIGQEDLNDYVLNELRPLHEAWSGVELEPNNAYGLRVYREGSNLNMHIDKTSTHIISSILHVDHDLNMEPWPIIIEDFQGNTNEVFLESGDLLFYESSKCLHGRPRRMKGEGSWYSSLFIHYHPVDWDKEKVDMDQHYRIPPHWADTPTLKRTVDKLEVISSSVKEPECDEEWCNLKDTVKWHGPAPGYGKVLSATGITELHGIPSEDSFLLEDEEEEL